MRPSQLLRCARSGGTSAESRRFNGNLREVRCHLPPWGGRGYCGRGMNSNGLAEPRTTAQFSGSLGVTSCRRRNGSESSCDVTANCRGWSILTSAQRSCDRLPLGASRSWRWPSSTCSSRSLLALRAKQTCRAGKLLQPPLVLPLMMSLALLLPLLRLLAHGPGASHESFGSAGRHGALRQLCFNEAITAAKQGLRLRSMQASQQDASYEPLQRTGATVSGNSSLQGTCMMHANAKHQFGKRHVQAAPRRVALEHFGAVLLDMQSSRQARSR